MLSASVKEFPGPTLVTDGSGKPVGPWIVEREVRAARVAMELDRLHFHCLRHHLATLLIKWEDKDETTRAAIDGAIAARAASSSDVPAGAQRAIRQI
jgi:hypothetical protein